jgi:hypothetical protein
MPPGPLLKGPENSLDSGLDMSHFRTKQHQDKTTEPPKFPYNARELAEMRTQRLFSGRKMSRLRSLAVSGQAAVQLIR